MTRFISEEKIRREVETLFEQVGIEGPPVPVEEVARSLNARVILEPFKTDLSGVLHLVEEGPVIGVNSAQSRARQRFTIAHELGHLRLHGEETFVDRAFTFRRDQKAAAGTARQEIQANIFAAELLMPKRWLVEDIENQDIDIADDQALRDLTQRYDVSHAALAFRLANLQLG